MDGTLVDYDGGLRKVLGTIQGPGEPDIASDVHRDDQPDYMKQRIDLITGSMEWWENLPRHPLGFHVLNLAQEIGYRTMILTQGPRRKSNAWTGKKRWIDRELGVETDVTITRDKGLVYGKVLVDDYPPYVERWLSWRRRGLVIMPASKLNAKFSHPNVIRYDGKNLAAVKAALQKAFDRKSGEALEVEQ